jgi:hypothetical protein
VANKPRSRRGAGPARSGASGRPAPASAGAAPAGAAPAGAAPAGAAPAGAAPVGAVSVGAAPRGAAPASRAPAGTAQLAAPPAAEKATYPGQGLGLPERGPGSVASMPRRILALFIDWLLSMLIAYGLTHSQFWTIAVFAIEVYVLTATTGFTVGKRLVGIRTVRTNGGLVGFGWAAVRTAILLTAIPPLLTDRDLRGMHDRASDTVVIRL